MAKKDPVETGRSNVRYVEIGGIDGKSHELLGVPSVNSTTAPSRCRQVLSAGDTVFSTVRPYLERIAFIPPWLDQEFASTGFCVLRPGPDIDSRFLFFLAVTPLVIDQVLSLQKGVSYPAVLNREVLATRIPLPPLDEQRRIVAILEDHLSHLDSAQVALTMADRRADAMIKQVLVSAIPGPNAYPKTWVVTTVGGAGTVELGRQRHPDWHTGYNMHPYLRVANVFENRLDLTDVMEMHWPGNSFERFRLHPGDILLNEGQSPHLLGRPAIYRGDPPDVAFTNSLLRFQAGNDVLPEFALMVFRRHMHAGRFARESRITTNIAHLSASRLKAVEFPLPPLNEQKRIVDGMNRTLLSVAKCKHDISQTASKGQTLRRSLLAAAFRGDLTADWRARHVHGGRLDGHNGGES
ncbi:MAG: restriction endonuclease subunit S [Propionibacteriaceae bacterium]|nr:restriction endonuclease subunit S [Propionibacteriaceae bacterium]